MTDISLADVTIHIDQKPGAEMQDKVEAGLRRVDGVVSVRFSDKDSHLVVVEFNPDKTRTKVLLTMVQEIAGHAEAIGL